MRPTLFALALMLLSAANEQSDLGILYTEYSSHAANLTNENKIEWASRLRVGLKEGSDDTILRARVIDEIGALYNSVGQVKDAKDMYDMLLAESSQRGDYSAQIIALENLTSISLIQNGPSTQTFESYRLLEAQLQTPPPETAGYYGRKLVDVYGAHATAALSATNLSESASRSEYAAESVSYFNKYLENRTDDSRYPLTTMEYQAAQALLKDGQYERAANMLDAILESNQDSFPRARLESESAAARYGTLTPEYQEALEQIIASADHDTAASDEYFPRLLIDLADSYMNTGNPAKAIPLLQQLVVSDSKLLAPLPQRLLQLANALIQVGRISEASELLNQILKEYPNNVMAARARELLQQVTSEEESDNYHDPQNADSVPNPQQVGDSPHGTDQMAKDSNVMSAASSEIGAGINEAVAPGAEHQENTPRAIKN